MIRLRPAPLALVGAAALAVVGAGAPWVPSVGTFWWAAGALLLGAALIDVLMLSLLKPPTVERRVAPALSVGEWHPVTLSLQNVRGLSLSVEVFDDYPTEAADIEDLPQSVKVEGRSVVELTYRLRPTQRGEIDWPSVSVLASGPLRLFKRRFPVPVVSQARVYPDFRQVAKFAMLAMNQRVAQMGVHQHQRRGEGLEFLQLRDYRPGDSQRQVDWKATSRRGELVSREYREEQNQQVLLLLDCGRGMHAKDGALAHFDHVLNASLLLAHVALKESDAVGMMTFSGERRFFAPTKGAGALNSLVGQLYDLKTSVAPSDYVEAFDLLGQRQRRRALVVLLTNLRDDDAQELGRLVQSVRKRHLVLVASMRESELDAAATATANTFEEALTVTAANRYLDERRAAHEALRRAGAHTLDVTPAQLPVALVNKYLELKRRGAL